MSFIRLLLINLVILSSFWLRHHRPVTLWLGMYLVTLTIFWIESGSLVRGATIAILSATVKTVWGLTHGWLFGKGDCKRCRKLVAQTVQQEGWMI